MTTHSALERPGDWWLATLRRRAEAMGEETLDLSQPIEFASEEQRRATLKYFNAAFRAEQSGLTQAHQLADEVRAWDAELAEVLELYGKEEGWHQQLLEQFLAYLGGGVQPMGRVTRLFYRLYAGAKRMETIVLTNLMFETIGSTTYRLTLRRVEHPALKQMLTILTRDESFHVPLNTFFLRRVLERSSRWQLWRLGWLHQLLFVSLVALPLASRPKAKAFDGIGSSELARAYAQNLARLFIDSNIPLRPPSWLLWLFGITHASLRRATDHAAISVAAAEAAADRRNRVTAL